jgi:beta-N-acetylhexosaminidase
VLTALLCALLGAAIAVPAASAPASPSIPGAAPTTSTPAVPAPGGFWGAAPPSAGSPEQSAARLAASMSDEELLGQTLCFGYLGDAPSADIRAWIRDRGIGGVKIFSRNVADLPSLARDVADMQRLSQSTRLAVPLLVATDQEGGWVRHVKRETSVTPGNLAVGAGGLPHDAYLTGWYLGRELAALGINMDFAPTADTYSDPEATVIGPRSFGSDPAAVGLFSAAYAAGLAAAGVMATAKHFPGHGSADRDSHGRLPVIRVDLETLLARDLLPYRILAREGVPAVMSGHLAFPDILGDLTPASLSPFLLRGVLRDRIGFRGMVVTDDMEMEGVLNGTLDVAAACRLALKAGNDLLLISHSPPSQEKAWRALAAAMRREPGFRAVVAEAATRVLAEKLRFLGPRGRDALFPDPDRVAASVPAPGAAEFFRQSAARAVTLVAGRRVPWRPVPGERVLLCGQLDEFFEEGTARWPGADTLAFSYDPFYAADPGDLERIPPRARQYDTVVFCLANYNSLAVLERMRDLGPRLLVVSALSPVYLAEVPWVSTAVAVYGSGRDSFRAGFAVLAGEIGAAGTMPVSFPGAAP